VPVWAQTVEQEITSKAIELTIVPPVLNAQVTVGTPLLQVE